MAAHRFTIAVAATCWIISGVVASTRAVKDENSADYWRTLGQKKLKAALDDPRIETVAKNVIFFLGDGMGIPTVTAMRIYKGQKNGKSGEEEELAFDKFPFVSLSKTYALDRQNPDSANTATAYFCGVKANYGTVGVDGRVSQGDCESSLDNGTHVSSILQWAQEAGKRTGLVTTTRVTHATPSGLYAHIAHRDWEAFTPDGRCEDIAYQLVHQEPGQNINVILGGGREAFLPQSEVDVSGVPGKRQDARNLLNEWLKMKQKQKLAAKSVFDYDTFAKLDLSEVDYLLGLFNSSHIPYVPDRAEAAAKAPTLVEMTRKAIEVLRNGPDGFFLAVEGGRIDLAHHDNSAYRALEEGVELDQAIQAALDMTDRKDTLIVVTADHSHTLSIGGDYPARGSNILGLGGFSDVDNLTMTILSYANGPGYKGRRNLTEKEVLGKDYHQDVTYPMLYETHGAEDVAVYAVGPMAHLFHGVHDQSYIPYVMGYASCVGSNKDHCNNSSPRLLPTHALCMLAAAMGRVLLSRTYFLTIFHVWF